MWVKDGPREKPFRCTKCSKLFTRRGVLYNHYRKIHNSRPSYQCAECLQSFPLMYDLNKHKMKDHEEKVKKHGKVIKILNNKNFNHTYKKKIIENNIFFMKKVSNTW